MFQSEIQYCDTVGEVGYLPVSDDDWSVLVVNKVVWSCIWSVRRYRSHSSDSWVAMVIVVGHEIVPAWTLHGDHGDHTKRPDLDGDALTPLN